MRSDRKSPLLTISCDNKEVREYYYDAGILEIGFTFSTNGVANHHCEGTFDECVKSIDEFITRVR